MSSGEISTNKTRDNRIESIVGYVSLGSYANYCYYTSNLSGYSKISGSFSYDTATFQLSDTVSIESYTVNSLVEALNAYVEYYIFRVHSHWLLNKGENVVSFTVNEETNLHFQLPGHSPPNLASEGNMIFDGWYTDKDYLMALTSTKITGETMLSWRYCTVIIATLNVNGGNELVEKEMVIGCDGVYGKLPVPTRTAHTFSGWFVKRIGEKRLKQETLTRYLIITSSTHTGPPINTLSPSSLPTELNPR